MNDSSKIKKGLSSVGIIGITIRPVKSNYGTIKLDGDVDRMVHEATPAKLARFLCEIYRKD